MRTDFVNEVAKILDIKRMALIEKGGRLKDLFFTLAVNLIVLLMPFKRIRMSIVIKC